MRWTIPAFLLLLALPLGAVAANRVGDADNSGSLNATDAALVQARVLGIVDEWSISPLALADEDGDLDLADMMLVAQAANGQRVISGPGNWLTFVDPGSAFAVSGGPPVPLLWGVYSTFFGVAENTDGLDVGFTKLPGTAQSTLATPTATVTGLAALAQLNPLNTTGSAQNVTVRMTLDIRDSSGATHSNIIRNAIVNVSSSNCGDGAVDGGEECDDGNGIDGDGCNGLCIIEYCGDGILQAGLGEECDDGPGGHCMDNCAGEYETISAGSDHTCWLRDNGTIACWGGNWAGVSEPADGIFLSVSAKSVHGCGLRPDNTVSCWGENWAGQASPPGGSFYSVSAGGSHTCGVRMDNTLVCWGYNGQGESTPPPGSFLAVSAGEQHTCAIRIDRTLVCWGLSNYGQSDPPGGTFRSVSSGYHNCAIRSDSTVACWGPNWAGQASPPAGSFLSVDASNQNSCGLRSDHTLACWGVNMDGQATPPPGIFIAVSTAGYHSCAISSVNSVVCWGGNVGGQSIPPGAAFISVSAGGEGYIVPLEGFIPLSSTWDPLTIGAV